MAVVCTSECINGECTDRDTCTCNEGWTGQTCDKEQQGKLGIYTISHFCHYFMLTGTFKITLLSFSMTTSAKSSGSRTGVIAGVVVAVIVCAAIAVAVAVAVYFAVYKKRGHRKRQDL